MRKKTAHVTIKQTSESSRRNDKRFRALIDKSSDVIALINKKKKIIYISPAIKDVLGYSPKEFINIKNPFRLVQYVEIPKVLQLYDKLIKKKKNSTNQELQVIHKDGSFKWIEASATNYLQEKNVEAIVVNFRDISHRKRSEIRQKFLDELNKKLTARFDHSIALQDIARLIVPQVADYCRIVVVGDNNKTEEVTISRKDPKKVRFIHDDYENYRSKNYTFGISHILKTGKPELIDRIDEDVLESVDNPELLQVIKNIGLKSYMGVPLLVRKKVIGAITFSSAVKNRFFTKNDFKFAQEIARQVAFTLENIHLHKKAQEAIESRDEFISMASHELKTPLTSLKVFIQLLEKWFRVKGDESSRRVLQKMSKNIEKLTTLVSDLLDMSRIQQGKLLEMQLEKFLIKDLAIDIIEDLQPISAHTLTLDWHTKLLVYADKDRIRQVLINFITNAIKYSPESEKIIIGSMQIGKSIKIYVKDFGIGISQEEQKKIFQRFYQGNPQNTYPGLGLGLYISSEIIKRHNGRVGVYSEKGKGSTFYFTLPIYSKKK